MDEAEWDEAVVRLRKASDAALVLSRCLAVDPHLTRWRTDDNELEGQLAADGLDQALGKR
jgi:hypothetical protein